MASVIVPAHNEASVIRRCLDSLNGQAGLDTLIVACNGCTDNTAEIVRKDTPMPSVWILSPHPKSMH